ncbi:MAD1L1 [Branchiostoma lanceolatum]|uniref:Mitotic spindle assembly checkpoint protein MAD1 n=1 Tax=Branchiostoma lanceolatum TaxID=7740 RepID=A0A8K0AG76_BRALA|nr:MAD1L1 [Branchiostoma lanceolatum]
MNVTPEDNTTVVRMMGDFNSYLAEGRRQQSNSSLLFDMGDTTAGKGDLTMQLDTTRDDSTVQWDRPETAKRNRVRRLEQTQAIEKEGELLFTRSKVAKLETAITQLTTEKKRDKIEFEKGQETFRLQYERDLEQVNDLRHKLEFLVKEEKQAKEELAEERKKLTTIKTQMEKRIMVLQREKLCVQAELDELREASRSQISNLRNQVKRLEAELEMSDSELAEAQQQVQHHQGQAQARLEQVQQLQEDRIRAVTAEHKVKELELQLNQVQESAAMAKLMSTRLSRYEQLEKENKKLLEQNKFYRETSENNQLLKEKLLSLETKYGRADHSNLELIKEVEDLRGRLKQWEGIDPSGGQIPRSPAEIAKWIAELQRKEVLLTEKTGQLTSSARDSEAGQKAATGQLREVESQLFAATEKTNQQADLIKKLQRRLLLVTKDRDSIRNILVSYESEVTRASSDDAMLQRLQDSEEAAQRYQRHMASLEEEMQRVNAQASEERIKAHKLEVELSQMKAQTPAPAPNPISSQEVTMLRKKVEDLEKDRQKLVEEKEILEARVEQRHLQGDYDPTKTKVVHFGLNPTALRRQHRQEELEKLREECEKLRQQLRAAEEGGGADVTASILQTPSSKEMEDLKKQLTTAETKNTRLKEVFQQKIHEFRQACYMLLGYKVDVVKDNNYKLMSMYAERQEDCLMFQMVPGGELQLLETEFSNSQAVMMLVDLHLKTQHSIPAFLSALTLDLFSQQTIA